MYAEGYPKGLGGLGTGLDLFQVVVFLVLAAAALEPAGPFLGNGRCEFFPLFLVLSRPSLALEVGKDTVCGGEGPVFVGRIDRVGTGQPRFRFCEPLGGEHGVHETVALVEGVETQVLDEADAVDLELVDLRAEPDLLYFLATAHDRAQVVLVDTDDTPWAVPRCGTSYVAGRISL